MSASMPATQGPDCQLKPAWTPKIMPLSLSEVLVGDQGRPSVESLKTVSVLDLPKP